jgi:hypothetical protein
MSCGSSISDRSLPHLASIRSGSPGAPELQRLISSAPPHRLPFDVRVAERGDPDLGVVLTWSIDNFFRTISWSNEAAGEVS